MLLSTSTRKYSHDEGGGMRTPEAALIRARAKAPLPDLLVLHLSDADIECIKHLELCNTLRSLYADENHIKDLEGVIELRKLWRIDLNGNILKNLHALASFRALGFLYLERNRICFEDLICLRDQHLMELRLLGNEGLMKGNSIDEYRKKVVALLPNVWILDGNFISTAERQQAIEGCDTFVVNLLENPNRSAVSDSKFGSATDMWVPVGSELVTEDSADLTSTASLIDIAHKPVNTNDPPDLRRLYAIVSFHNAESALHNKHCHFAPSKHTPNSRLMPKIWLDELLALPRRTRIDVVLLLAVFLQFRFPKMLLSEALTITQLDCPHFPSEAIRDIVNLPPYGLVALITITRHESLEKEQLMRQELKPEVATPEFEDESELLGAIPPLFTTLFSTINGSANPVGESDPQATTMRCRQVLKLLSNVASFPDPELIASKGKGKREAIFRELAPLIRAADSRPVDPATQNGRDVVVPRIAVSNHKTTPKSPTRVNVLSMKRKVPVENRLGGAVDLSPEEDSGQCNASLDQPVVTASAARKKPKPGDWVEVHAKQFVKIQFLSDDGLFVVGALPSDTSRSLTISLNQMSWVSSNIWRANSKQQAEALPACAQRTKSDSSTTNTTRIGKLHRDSEAFHRHGAARNQGFPNHFVTAQMLSDMDRERGTSTPSSTKTIEIFSSNDTLDVNYVLTSPNHISAQNFCAISTFLQQSRQPRGLWSPVAQSAPYTVLSSPTPSLSKSASLNELKMTKPHAQQKVAIEPQQIDDWFEIRRAMQAQLGIADTLDTTERPLTSNSSDVDIQTRNGVSCFLTAAPDCGAVADTSDSMPIERIRLQSPSPLGSSVSQQKLVIGGGVKLVAVRGWHQVATKTEFVVAAPIGVSHSAPLLPVASTKLNMVVLPSISRKPK